MSSSVHPEPRPLPDREREWVFRLLYAHAFNRKRAVELVRDVRGTLVLSEEDWQTLAPPNPYVPDVREGHIQEETWQRIQGPVLAALEGILADLPALERAIQDASKRWRIDRMAVIERTLLTLGAYELLSIHARPVKRIINRTVELAKKYGEADSKRFVNGILDQIRKNHHLGSE